MIYAQTSNRIARGTGLLSFGGGGSESAPSGINSGILFSWVDVETIRLVPSRIDGKAIVHVTSGTDLVAVELDAALDCDLSVSGAGGLDAGAEAVSSVYVCRLVTEDAGENPALLFTLTNTAITLPGSYTHWSEPLAFAVNDSGGDIEPFEHDPSGWFTFAPRLRPLWGGKSTVYTSIPLQTFCPYEASRMTVQAEVQASTGAPTLNSCTLKTKNQTDILLSLATTTAFQIMQGSIEAAVLNDPSDCLHYAWTAAPGGGDPGLVLYLRGVLL